MTIIYRTVGAWGGGKGVDLNPDEVDRNFHDHEQRIDTLEANSGLVSQIDSFIVNGSQFFVQFTNHTQIGPYQLPTAQFNFRGAWTPSTNYFIQDIITNDNSTYLVLFDHTSGLTFDPNANDGFGHNYYGLMLAGASSTTLKTVSVSTYSLLAIDAGKYIRFTHVGGCVVTIPKHANAAIALGAEISLRDAATSGALTIVTESGVILHVPRGFLAQSFSVNSTMGLKQIAIDEWDLMGLLAPHV